MIELAERGGATALDDGIRRRDFITVAALSFAGVGVVSATIPLVTQMNPSADLLAVASTEVDLSKIAPGQPSRPSGASSQCLCAISPLTK